MLISPSLYSHVNLHCQQVLDHYQVDQDLSYHYVGKKTRKFGSMEVPVLA
jgi:hypothetical protein